MREATELFEALGKRRENGKDAEMVMKLSRKSLLHGLSHNEEVRQLVRDDSLLNGLAKPSTFAETFERISGAGSRSPVTEESLQKVLDMHKDRGKGKEFVDSEISLSRTPTFGSIATDDAFSSIVPSGLPQPRLSKDSFFDEILGGDSNNYKNEVTRRHQEDMKVKERKEDSYLTNDDLKFLDSLQSTGNSSYAKRASFESPNLNFDHKKKTNKKSRLKKKKNQDQNIAHISETEEQIVQTATIYSQNAQHWLQTPSSTSCNHGARIHVQRLALCVEDLLHQLELAKRETFKAKEHAKMCQTKLQHQEDQHQIELDALRSKFARTRDDCVKMLSSAKALLANKDKKKPDH